MTGPGLDPRPAGRASSRAMGYVVMVALFAAGVAAGVAFDHGVLHRRPAPGDPRGGARFSGQGFAPEFVPGAPIPRRTGPTTRGHSPSIERFAHDLELTPAQTVVVDSAMARDFAAVTDARLAMQPRVDSIIAATRARIDSVLTPAQREKYHALVAAQQRRAEELARQRRSGPGGPAGPM